MINECRRRNWRPVPASSFQDDWRGRLLVAWNSRELAGPFGEKVGSTHPHVGPVLQSGIGMYQQTPCLQVAIVHSLASSQSVSVTQGAHPRIST